ncbi:MAG: ABC transporter ATP-binding protein [Clostridiales Family XIII bacterium]|jgi:ABC-2 type transport system ATP-binding protein|nr:ABC transporter ATP-binding protein [Clostridiales Family XIII bacterium]
MRESVLTTHNLTKKYGSVPALDNVSLTLAEGDIYGLIGQNGAGKTTFFKCVMGLAKPTSGKIEIGGETRDLNAVRRHMGFMINPSFLPYLGPHENLEYLCRVKGIRMKGETERLLKIVGLADVRKPFKKFSLGMKQRLGIAGALLGSPAIVVLDEPINGLDPQGIIEMRTVIRDAHRESGATFIISSHILSELDLVATYFGFIEKGRLLKQISHKELHEATRKSLCIEVDNTEKAVTALKATLGARPVVTEKGQLVLESHLEEPDRVAQTLAGAGVTLYGLHRQETTLEDYFIGLVNGGEHYE